MTDSSNIEGFNLLNSTLLLTRVLFYLFAAKSVIYDAYDLKNVRLNHA